MEPIGAEPSGIKSRVDETRQVRDGDGLRVLIADPCPLCRTTLRERICGKGTEVDEVDNFSDLGIALASQDPWDFLLLDLELPGMRSPSVVRVLRDRYPELVIVMLFDEDSDPLTPRALANVMRGGISKSASLPLITNSFKRLLDGKSCWPKGTRWADRDGGEYRFNNDCILWNLTPKQLQLLTIFRSWGWFQRWK